MKMRMIILIATLSAAAFGQTAAGNQNPDTCLTCHSALADRLGNPAQLIQNDIHIKNGFTCVSCHGGNSASMDMGIAMNPRAGFLGKIDRRKIPEVCGGCHSDSTLIHEFAPQQRVDQLALYRTSVHGKRLSAGDTAVAVCIDCHSVHDIRAVKDASSPVYPLKLPETCARCHADASRMAVYNASTDQFEQYRRSVHWEALTERRDLTAPNCATCHGNHGAAPPGVESAARVCGTCHGPFQNLFDQSPHKAAFDALGLAGCVVCHSNHEIQRPGPDMLGVSPGAVCVTCHVQGDSGYMTASSMRNALDNLRSEIADAEQILRRAETFGMEVSEGRFQLAAATEAGIKARLAVHKFQLDEVANSVRPGLEAAQKGRETGLAALHEREIRRIGLAASLVAISVTIIGLWLAIRELEGRKRRRGPT